MSRPTSYLLIERSDCCCGNCPHNVTAFPTAQLREEATARAIFGDEPPPQNEWIKYRNKLVTEGKVTFEGDPPIEWLDACFQEIENTDYPEQISR